MSKILISVRFFVGGRTMSGRDVDLKAIRLLPYQQGIDAYTVINSQGFYKGMPENSVIIEIHVDLPNEKCSDSKACVFEINKLNNLANALRREFNQEMVIAEVVVRNSTRVEWSHWSTVDSGEVFPFPAHIVSLVWDGPSARNSLDIPGFFHALTQSAQDILGTEYMPYNDWPIVVVPARKLELNLQEIGDSQKCGEFDDAIVKRSTEKLRKLEGLRASAGDYIARFRRAENLPIFIVNNLAALLTPSKDEAPLIEVNEAPFKESFGCVEMAYLDLLEAWLSNGKVEFDKLGFLNCMRPMLSVLAITFSKDDRGVDRVVVKQRSGNVSIYPNDYTCVPWGYLEPMLSEKPSVVDTFLQEIDEELLNGPERETDRKALVKRLKNLEGKLQYLGYIVDLLRPRIDIILMFEPSQTWWHKNRPHMRLNWEFENEPIVLEGVKRIAEGEKGLYVPATVAAARLAMKEKARGS